VPANGKQERVEDQTIRLVSGRTVGFADYGIPDATAVLWCHGGPGSRLEPAYLRRQASEAGLRIIGIDRPGYGLSTPQPGRTIAGWVPEGVGQECR
jgi:pimeloyl-ACP methyl ester carboxylesterase